MKSSLSTLLLPRLSDCTFKIEVKRDAKSGGFESDANTDTDTDIDLDGDMASASPSKTDA